METLAERIARDGPVSELDAIGWAIRLAKRLEALHALGVAHGSVSPACVIAAGQDRNARAYLADVQHTASSPAYHSPERILGGDISVADDVWALSATLYALLTGQSPFTGHNEGEIRQKIFAAAPAPLAVFDVGDDDLQHILDRAFAREIGQRMAGVSAFRHALEEWHPDRGVANLPPLEDEDSTNEDDEDDAARTMLVRDAGAFMHQAGLAGAPAPRPGPHAGGSGLGAGAPAAREVVALPRVANDDDDDDDNVRTVMRVLPKDDLAAIIARAAPPRAQPPAAPGPAAPAPAAFHAPGPPVPAPAHMSPAHARPAPFPAAGPGAFPRPGPPRAGPPPRPEPPAPAPALAAPAPVAAAPIPSVDDHDSEDDDIRTVMRTPEQMIEDEQSHDAPRTMLLRDGDALPGMPGPAGAPLPAAGAYPAAGSQAWPAPAPTVALPVHYEPAAPSFSAHEPPMHEPMLTGALGTQKIPPVESFRGGPQGPGGFAPGPQAGPGAFQPFPMGAAQNPAAQPGARVAMGETPNPPAQPGAFAAGPGGAPLGAAPGHVLGAGPAPNLLVPASAPASGGKRGLILAALIALLIAAAATFAFLKLKGL